MRHDFVDCVIEKRLFADRLETPLEMALFTTPRTSHQSYLQKPNAPYQDPLLKKGRRNTVDAIRTHGIKFMERTKLLITRKAEASCAEFACFQSR